MTLLWRRRPFTWYCHEIPKLNPLRPSLFEDHIGTPPAAGQTSPKYTFKKPGL